MVASMAYRDTEVAAVPDVAEGALVRTPPDWRRLYEQTLERAEAAEAARGGVEVGGGGRA